ncbi:GspH/FimT family protein [Pseudomonas sp.]|uniref:GspH/FimT family protein n=1 Tax=Pseudomonas sp. TaxID=306 RepID=UPI00299EC4CB|nr:GspH/FimT family protein [Pseudomonas sp.]MDX1367457.1 GspH/FimT family protein [Pseudomonas sp.]
MRSSLNAGFSLLEALMALALIASLLGIATPALSGWVHKQKMHSLQTDLFHMATQARYLAMTRQSRVTLCPLTAQAVCSQQWTESLSSFIDSNGNRRLDQGEEIISTLQLPSGIALNWRGMRPTNSIHFSSQGVTFVSNGTMSLCPRQGSAKPGAIVINRQGRMKVSGSRARCPL